MLYHSIVSDRGSYSPLCREVCCTTITFADLNPLHELAMNPGCFSPIHKVDKGTLQSKEISFGYYKCHLHSFGGAGNFGLIYYQLSALISC